MKRVLAAVAAMLAVILLPAAPAWAHNRLVSAEPARDATVTASPQSVRLSFFEALDPQFTTIVVTDAARRPMPAGKPGIAGKSGTLALTGALADGTYTVAYRVVSTDGHPVQGSYTFRVAGATPPSAAPPSAAAPASPAAAASTPAPSGGMPPALLYALIGLAVVLAGSAVFAVRRRR